MPNGSASTLHLAITDETGNTAILEYLNGELNIHEGKEYQVMTNSPRYEYQLAINDYWKEVGGLQMLPGTNRSSDRFVRASFYVHAIPQTADAKIAVPSVLSVMRTVSVPFGITTPDKLISLPPAGVRSPIRKTKSIILSQLSLLTYSGSI